MAITRAATSQSYYTGSSYSALTFNSLSVGDFIVVIVTGSNTNTISGISTSGSTGAVGSWSQAGSLTGTAPGSPIAIDVRYAYVTTAGNISVVPTANVYADGGFSVHVYRGIASSSPQVDTAKTAYDDTGSVTSLSTSTIVVSATDSVCVAVAANETADKTFDWTYGTPDYTEQTHATTHVHATADCINSSSGTFGCGVSWSGSLSNDSALLVVIFCAAAAPPAVTLQLADAGAASDLIAFVQQFAQVMDSGAGSDQLAQIAAVLSALADAGSGADSVSSSQLGNLILVPDAGSGADALGDVTVTLTLSDAAAAADLVSQVLAALPEISDSGSGADVLTVVTFLAKGKVRITFTARRPVVSITAKRPGVAFSARKPGVTFH